MQTSNSIIKATYYIVTQASVLFAYNWQLFFFKEGMELIEKEYNSTQRNS